MFSPVVLFVHARPEHTRRTLDALVANSLADQTQLIIYADAPRNFEEIEPTRQVRAIAREVSGFLNITITEREDNYGLARNIIEGVTEVCNQYGRVIVLEDDIITSPGFLTFMNAALTKYANEPRVWHISGWNYPINLDGLGDMFFWRAMNCWGWATWSDRWKHFRKNPDLLVSELKKHQIKRFNIDGFHDFWSQVTANKSGDIDTWAIFWYATIFEHDGLCLQPSWSLVRNIGHDGTGENCQVADGHSQPLLNARPQVWPRQLEEHDEALRRIKDHFIESAPSLARRVSNRVRRIHFLRERVVPRVAKTKGLLKLGNWLGLNR